MLSLHEQGTSLTHDYNNMPSSFLSILLGLGSTSRQPSIDRLMNIDITHQAAMHAHAAKSYIEHLFTLI